MQALYGAHSLKQDEITAIAAFLQSQPKEPGRTDGRWSFALMGMGGCVLALAVMNASWSKRFRAVRSPLANGHETKRKAGR
jgi:hypothetical protein